MLANAVVLNLDCTLKPPGELLNVPNTNKPESLGSGAQASAFFTQTGRDGFFTSSQGRVTKDKPLGRQSLGGRKRESL